MEKLGSIAIAPVVGIAMEPIVAAYAACMRDFKAEVSKFFAGEAHDRS